MACELHGGAPSAVCHDLPGIRLGQKQVDLPPSITVADDTVEGAVVTSRCQGNSDTAQVEAQQQAVWQRPGQLRTGVNP